MIFQGGSLWAGVASGAMSQLRDTQDLKQGSLDRKEYAIQTTGNVTGAIGVMAGVEYGAILGTSLLPGFGTIVGAVAGGMLGDKVGRAVGNKTGGMLFNRRSATDMTEPAVAD